MLRCWWWSPGPHLSRPESSGLVETSVKSPSLKDNHNFDVFNRCYLVNIKKLVFDAWPGLETEVDNVDTVWQNMTQRHDQPQVSLRSGSDADHSVHTQHWAPPVHHLLPHHLLPPVHLGAGHHHADHMWRVELGQSVQYHGDDGVMTVVRSQHQQHGGHISNQWVQSRVSHITDLLLTVVFTDQLCWLQATLLQNLPQLPHCQTLQPLDLFFKRHLSLSAGYFPLLIKSVSDLWKAFSPI